MVLRNYSLNSLPTLLKIAKPVKSSDEPQIGAGPKIHPHSRWRAIFSFPVVLATALVVLTVLTVRASFDDPDLWYHLKIGQIILNTHFIPRVDMFSFTASGHPWVAQEWLSQLTLYGVYKLGGYTALMVWFCTVTSLLLFAEFVLCTFYSGNVKVAFFGGMITWLFVTVGISIRPHLVGYLLLVCELLILYLGRSRDSRWFLALPFLFGFWINSHGSFFFGLVVLAVILFRSFLEVHWGLVVSRRWEKHARSTLAIASVLSLAALTINPLGLKLILNPVEVMGKLPVNLSQVQEWQPPHFDTARGLGLLAVTGLIVLIPLLRQTELALEEVLLTGLGFGFAVLHERMVFIFGILAAPILCRLLADLWDRYEPEREQPLLNLGFIVISLFAIVWAFPNRDHLQKQLEHGSPVKALEYIKRANLSGPMLNEYVFGGYLIWAAPQYKVFIDGRGDIFELTGVLSEYGDWIMVHGDPRVLLDKYHINFCLISRDAPVAHVLPLLPGWKLVYSDHLSSVFTRRI